ncbi:MAG: DUF2073 domain-containing protein [Candidatus Thorarchaeota archaeon]
MKYYVDFITKSATDKLTTFEKIKMIIRLVRQNRVLIIENGLSPEEEAELIKQTMMVIDFNNFIGVEFFNWDRNSAQPKRIFKKSPQNNENHYTVVAPTEAIQIVEDSVDLLSIKLQA